MDQPEIIPPVARFVQIWPVGQAELRGRTWPARWARLGNRLRKDVGACWHGASWARGSRLDVSELSACAAGDMHQGRF